MKMKKILTTSFIAIAILGTTSSFYGSNYSKKLKDDELCSIAPTSTSLPLLTSRSAMGIQNNTSNKIEYFYSNIHNEKNKWHDSHLDSGKYRWDYGWDWFTINSNIEFKIDAGHETSLYVVIGYGGFGYYNGVAVATEYFYWTYQASKITDLPSRNAKIWEKKTIYSTSYDTNFHTDFRIDDNNFYQESYSPLQHHIIITYPVTPWNPLGPGIPFIPWTPIEPGIPITPWTPIGPSTPVTPWTPIGPSTPITPWTPIEPGIPISPWTPYEPSQASHSSVALSTINILEIGFGAGLFIIIIALTFMIWLICFYLKIKAKNLNDSKTNISE